MSWNGTFPLSAAERSSLYAKLASLGARVFHASQDDHFQSISPEEALVIAAEESRFDYRLLYVLVELLSDQYTEFNPFKIRSAAHGLKTPQVWGVIAEYSSKVRGREDQGHFFGIILEGLTRTADQMYFNDLRRPRPEKARAIAFRTPDEFRKWGFFSDESPVSKELQATRKLKNFSPKRRREILDRLLRKHFWVGIRDYLKEIDFSVSRQQAHRDLSSFPGIQTRGSRRGQRYFRGPAAE